MKRSLQIGLLSLALLSLSTVNAAAQCPMCSMAVESNMSNGGDAGAGLNNGILYMLGLPYFIIGVVAFVWWRNRRKEGEEEQAADKEEVLSEQAV